MHGYRTYAVKLYQNHKAEDLSALIKSRLVIDGQNNVNSAHVLTDADYAEKSRALANGILNVTREVKPVFDTEYEAQAHGEAQRQAIRLALIELGYDVADVNYTVNGAAQSGYEIVWEEVMNE